MNNKVSNARQILLNLRRKYCSDSINKFKKPSYETNDELSSDDDKLSVSSKKQSPLSDNIPNISSVLINNDVVCRKDNMTVVNDSTKSEVNEHSVEHEDKSIKYIDLKPKNYLSENVSDTELSSIVTDLKDENDVMSGTEDVSDETRSSSAGNILFNVHLVQDANLDDIESIIDSEDGARSRPSLLLTPKSINLGSPIEAPKTATYDYESDFEYSDDESVDFSHSKVDNFEGNNGEELSIDKPPIAEESIGDSDIASEALSSQKNEHNTSQSSYNANIVLVNDNYPSISDVNSEIVFKNDKESIASDDQSDNRSYMSAVSGSVTSAKDVESTRNIPTKKMIKSCILVDKTDKGVNVSLPKCYCKSVGVQTSKAADIDKSEDDVIDFNKPIHRKVYRINTSVESKVHRPVVSAGSNLSSNDGENLLNGYFHGYNPYTLVEQVSEGMPAEKIINQMLRSQIEMTRYFINCHHRMYMQCCQTVKTMNKAYMKNDIHYVIK